MKTLTSVLAIVATYVTAQYSAGYFLTKHDISQAKQYCGEPCSTSKAKSVLAQTEKTYIHNAGYRQAARDYLTQRP